MSEELLRESEEQKESTIRIGKWKANDYRIKRTGIIPKRKRKPKSYTEEQEKLLTLNDKQRLNFREQFESILDEIPGFFEYEKTARVYDDETDYQMGVPLFPDSEMIPVNQFSYSRVAAKEKRLKTMYLGLTTGSIDVPEENRAISAPFTKCRMDGCNFTYITLDTLDRHMRTRHSQV